MKRDVAVWIFIATILVVAFFVWTDDKVAKWQEPDSEENISDQSSELRNKTETSKKNEISASDIGASKNLKELISYEVPENWNEFSGTNYTEIRSPDYLPGDIWAPDRGMEIYITYVSNLEDSSEFETLGKVTKDLQQEVGLSDFSETDVGGIPALSYHLDYEGHALEYRIIKGGYYFLISFASADISEERRYQKEISEFLNSLKFN